MRGLILRMWRERGARADLALGAIILAGLLTLASILAALLGPRLHTDLAASAINADTGFAYVAPVALKPPFGFRVTGDSIGNFTASSLQLTENGRLLGPSHSAHDDIRSRGKGRYSHWRTQLYFSAADSSDPRSNGRRYSIEAQASLSPLVWLAVGLFDALALMVAWPWLAAHARFRGRFLAIAGVIAILLAALAAFGAFGRINEAAGEPKDTTLVMAVLLHAVLGAAVLLAQWAAGAGVARLLLRTQKAAFADILVLGFMLGLPIVAVLSAIALALPYGVSLAVACWLLCCSPLWSWRPPDSDLAGIARGLAAMLPLAIAFGCWIGLLWHGPTETLGGSPSGDPVFYSTAIMSLSGQLYPFRDLGYVFGPPVAYFNMLYSLMGAAIGKVVPLDPLLFILASGAVTFVLAVGLLLHLYIRGTGILAHGPHRRIVAVTLVLTIIVANRFPYWVVGSVPVIHAVPVTIGVAYWARKTDSFSRLLAVFLAVIGSALSKVVALTVLAPFAAASLVAGRFRISGAYLVATLIAAAAGAFLATVLLYMFGSFFFALAPPGPMSLTMSWSPHALGAVMPVAMREIAAVMLAGTAFLLTDRLRAAAIAFGFLLFLIYPFLFYFDFICSIILLGLVACDDPERLQRHRVLVLGALLLALPAAVLTDLAGTSSGLVWLLCVGGVTWASMPRETSQMSWGLVRVGVVTSLLLCVGLFGVARGNLVLSSGWEPGVLTPSVRGIWLAVRERTPVDALIFTDQTGTEPTLLSGWNTYAIMGGRQIFVSSIYTNSETRLNRQRALEVLGQNDAVLQGRMFPDQLRLPRKFSSFYAVVSCSRPIPPSWRKIFGNPDHCLYEMKRSSDGAGN